MGHGDSMTRGGGSSEDIGTAIELEDCNEEDSIAGDSDDEDYTNEDLGVGGDNDDDPNDGDYNDDDHNDDDSSDDESTDGNNDWNDDYRSDISANVSSGDDSRAAHYFQKYLSDESLLGQHAEHHDLMSELSASVSRASEFVESHAFRVWGINLKGVGKRLGALKRYLRKLAKETPYLLPDVIAVQDPSVAQVFRRILGYNFWYSATGTFTEADAPPTRSARQKSKQRVAQPVQGTRPNPTEDANPGSTQDTNVEREKPKMHKVCFYVHKSLSLTSWRVSKATGPNEDLVATLELATPSGELKIHNVYNHEDRLDVEELVALAGGEGDRILLGDFNFHHRMWSGTRRGVRTEKGNRFAASIDPMNLELLTEPGTITFSNSKDTSARSSTIDLTFASGRIASSVESCVAKKPMGFETDHRIIETAMKLTVLKENKIKLYWSKVTMETFQRHLKSLLPPHDFILKTHEQISAFFAAVMEALIRTVRACVPRGPCRREQKPPTGLDLKMERTKAELEKLWERAQMPGHENLKLQADEISWRIQQLDNMLWQRSTEKRSKTTRGAYGLAKLGKKISQPQEPCQVPPLLHEGRYYHQDKEKTTLIEKTMFRANENPDSKVVQDLPPGSDSEGRRQLFVSQDLDDEELRLLIKNLPKGKACGPDEIPYEAIQLGGDLLRFHLLRGFKACLEHGVHPDAFKDSNIVMLRKAGKPAHLPKSWRPIALLPCMGKLLEKIVALRMVAALKHSLPATQFGGRSTTEALQYMVNIIYGAWSKSTPQVVTLLALDISGAYNNVDRAKLLKMLVDKGMPKWIIEFIRSFLSNNTAAFHIPGYKSDRVYINTGIPQGSPLSPILFLLFASPLLKDLPLGKHRNDVKGNYLNAEVFCFSFVDDTYLIAVSNSYEANCRALTLMHDKVGNIARPLDILFGPDKYDLMHFRRPNARNDEGGDRSVTPNIPGFTKQPEEVSLRILGVQVDPQLTWSVHIDEIIAKVNRSLGYLTRISGSNWGPSLQTMRLFYLTTIRPIITYACGAWFIRRRRGQGHLRWGLKQKQVQKLESLQHKCLRKLSASFFKTKGLVLEKELCVENIWSVLHAQASGQRAKLLLRGWTRMNCRGSGKPKGQDLKNPHQVLNWEAVVPFLKAHAAFRQACSDDPEEARRWYDEKKRNQMIGRCVNKTAVEDCKRLWDTYVTKRKKTKESENSTGADLKYPAALTEKWGMQSFRTEIIGLNYHLHRIS
ncbi:zinc knuckle, partial [Fusarium albosuccineum]